LWWKKVARSAGPRSPLGRRFQSGPSPRCSRRPRRRRAGCGAGRPARGPVGQTWPSWIDARAIRVVSVQRPFPDRTGTIQGAGSGAPGDGGVAVGVRDGLGGEHVRASGGSRIRCRRRGKGGAGIGRLSGPIAPGGEASPAPADVRAEPVSVGAGRATSSGCRDVFGGGQRVVVGGVPGVAGLEPTRRAGEPPSKRMPSGETGAGAAGRSHLFLLAQEEDGARIPKPSGRPRGGKRRRTGARVIIRRTKVALTPLCPPGGRTGSTSGTW